MTENDYILCTNVAKLRLAITAISSMLPMNLKDSDSRDIALQALESWLERIEQAIDAAQSPGTPSGDGG